MKLSAPVSVKWLSEFMNAEIVGNDQNFITGINEIHQVEPGDIVFVDHPKYYATCINSAATCIIINSKEVTLPEGKTLLYCDAPFDAYAKLVHHFKPFKISKESISSDLMIGANSVVMPNVFIGANVQIGDHCIIQSNTVIGSDAFYYNTKKNRPAWYVKMPSCGRVVIEDKVEIGASCTIDRGVSGDTIIGMGSKLDNMVHIGHDTQLEANCLIAAQVGIAGGVKIKAGVTLWGQVGVNKTLTIGENAVVLGKSGVLSSIEGNKTYLGFPAEDASIKRREYVWIKRIPALWKKMMED
jgi:UDP-3-O-[3-hydroxymyristoyl] glucosamine N-acyltransferase